jgi:4-hydroxy-tetrahydrodipicolinate reductase
VVSALGQQTEIRLVGAVDLKATEDSLPLPDDAGSVPLSTSLDDILNECRPDVLVDFTLAPAVMPTARLAAEKGINLVIGTTGLKAEEIDELGRLSQVHQIGVVLASNFALGAVLMMHLAKLAAKYFDYAEIIELHHHRKADAPSGTALSTARAMVTARGKPFNVPEQKQAYPSRGEQIDGVTVHSVRLPGFLAHQEVIFGGAGQTLSIRHDTISRECFMPGVMMAIKEVTRRKGLTRGLDALLGL